MRHAIRTALLVATALTAAPALAESSISIPMDEARVITFNRPVKTVFIANPTVADVNMIDSRHAFILGKSFGATNIIALDSNGKPLASRHVTVLGGQALVTLNRGGEQLTFACSGARCEHSSAPGDNKESHDAFMGEVTAREDAATKSADASSGH